MTESKPCIDIEKTAAAICHVLGVDPYQRDYTGNPDIPDGVITFAKWEEFERDARAAAINIVEQLQDAFPDPVVKSALSVALKELKDEQ